MTEPEETNTDDTDSSDSADALETPKPKPKSARTGSVLGAAMLGLGDVLEPEKTNTDVVVEAKLDSDDDLGKKFDLDFGQLDDLDPQP